MASTVSCCVYITNNLSSPNNTNGSTPPLQNHSLKSPPNQKKPNRHGQNLTPKRPSVIEIERAIGAGRFRDADPRELEEEKNVKFDMSTLSFPGKFEKPLQRKIRESAGEWTEQTERAFRLSGKKILMFTFMWILPIWTFSLLVASGAIRLPFSNQFLDQLIM